jgi:RDD family protein
MHCKHCGFNNGADDHRCLRCGRRIGIAFAAPASYSGANALAVAPAFEPNDTQDFQPVSAGASTATAPLQPALFPAPASKVIQFPAPVGKLAVAPVAHPAPPPAAPTHARKPASAQQALLDFIATAPAQRTLRNDVPAQIDCEQTVAAPMHRFVASAIDAALILLGFGLFMGVCQLMGSSFGTGKLFWIAMGASLALIAVFYGLIFAMTGRETMGMYCTDLQLITFDGLPVEGPSRAARVAATWLSFCSGGLGLIWALADEENLTWHDHISKTFPTVSDGSASVVHRSR